MIRRFYILPLMPGVPDAQVQEMIAVLGAADRFIPGLLDSSAGVDLDSRTVIWENTFVDEASYSGPYMVHPYHIGAIDNYVMPDSPECITDNTYLDSCLGAGLHRHGATGAPSRHGRRKGLLECRGFCEPRH